MATDTGLRVLTGGAWKRKGRADRIAPTPAPVTDPVTPTVEATV